MADTTTQELLAALRECVMMNRTNTYEAHQAAILFVQSHGVALIAAVESSIAYRAALDRIIADDCDPVQVAHTAITPYTKWVPVSEEEAAEIDAAIAKEPK